MNSEKVIAFLEKLLEKTKRSQIRWVRLTRDFPSWADKTKCFLCEAGEMIITMLADEDYYEISFIIDYDDSLPNVELEIQTSQERQVALRLLNYVYNLFPNFEKCIDQFLNSD